MRKQMLLIILLITGMFSQAALQPGDSESNWKVMLSDVKVRYAWSVKLGAYITRAKFGEEVSKLDGKEITLKGFFLAADLTGNLFVLSSNPMATCFFCAAAGIETVVELEPHPDDARLFRRLRTDDLIEVRGMLQLNEDDYERLVYILKAVRLTSSGK